MIEIKNVTMKFGEHVALDNVSMTFKDNQITGLIGFNGSGKTTSFNLMTDFLEATSGEVLFDGKKIDRQTKRQIAYLGAGAEPKNPTRVLSHLYTMGALYDLSKKEVREIIDPIVKEIEFEQFLTKPIKALSKGNQQKIKVLAIMLNPKAKYLFLDEPFDGLDPIMVKKLSKIFSAMKGKTIILTSHRMEVVDNLCKEFFVLKDGALIDARKVKNSSIVVSVNKKVSMTKVRDLKFVLSVHDPKDGSGEWHIVIDKIDNYKALVKELVKSKEYIYSSIMKKDLSKAVFEGYGA